MTTLRRVENWPAALDQYFQSCALQKFSYGEFDCALFTAGGVHVMTGHDFSTGFRGAYQTGKGGFDLLNERGFGGFQDLIQNLGFPILPSYRFAQRGDLVLFDTPEGHGLGLVSLRGDSFFAVSPEGGLLALPLSQTICCWRV